MIEPTAIWYVNETLRSQCLVRISRRKIYLCMYNQMLRFPWYIAWCIRKHHLICGTCAIAQTNTTRSSWLFYDFWSRITEFKINAMAAWNIASHLPIWPSIRTKNKNVYNRYEPANNAKCNCVSYQLGLSTAKRPPKHNVNVCSDRRMISFLLYVHIMYMYIKLYGYMI